MTSHQSSVLKDRKQLELTYKDVEKRLQDQDFDCPDYWGGYCLKPNYFEFWQGRKSRLHDRLIFSLTDGNWTLKRLSP